MKKNLSKISLILVNLIPLVGVLWFDWTLFSILFLYWLESAVVGVYNIIKLFKISRSSKNKDDKKAVFAYVIFFIIHYGGFMAGHLVFLIVLGIFFEHGHFGLDIVKDNFLASLVPFLCFFISHGVSYYQNFISKKEYQKRALVTQMTLPYKRIILMHFLILILGFIVFIFNEPIWSILVLILVKLSFDLKYHSKLHQQLTGEGLKS